MDKQEAIAFLSARGLHAFERDWAMGETIGVATEPMDFGGGITGYRRVVHIVRGDKGWTVVEIVLQRSVESEPMPLADACVRAEAVLMSPLPNPPLQRT